MNAATVASAATDKYGATKRHSSCPFGIRMDFIFRSFVTSIGYNHFWLMESPDNTNDSKTIGGKGEESGGNFECQSKYFVGHKINLNECSNSWNSRMRCVSRPQSESLSRWKSNFSNLKIENRFDDWRPNERPGRHSQQNQPIHPNVIQSVKALSPKTLLIQEDALKNVTAISSLSTEKLLPKKNKEKRNSNRI